MYNEIHLTGEEYFCLDSPLLWSSLPKFVKAMEQSLQANLISLELLSIVNFCTGYYCLLWGLIITSFYIHFWYTLPNLPPPQLTDASNPPTKQPIAFSKSHRPTCQSPLPKRKDTAGPISQTSPPHTPLVPWHKYSTAFDQRSC